MSAKHTPGPWTYFVGNSNGRGLIRIETAHDAPIAGIHIASMPRGDQSKADADFLVHAANCHAELLEALKDCVQWLTAFAKGTGNEIIRETERYKKYTDAIARAEGGRS